MKICSESGVPVQTMNGSPGRTWGIGSRSPKLSSRRDSEPDMQTNVYLPQLELTMANVTVASVRVQVGDWIKRDQPLIEVESEKALSDVPAPDSGCVRKIFVRPGETVSEK